MSLRYRFVLGMGLMLVPLLAVAWSAVSSLHSQRHLLEEIMQEILHEKEPIMRVQDLVHRSVILLTGYLQDSGDVGYRQYREIAAATDEAFAYAVQLPFRLEIERKSRDAALRQWMHIKDVAGTIADGPVPDQAARISFVREIFTAHGEIYRALQVIQQKANEEINRAEGEIGDAERRMVWAVLYTFSVGFVIVIMVGLRLARSVLQPMRALGDGAKKLTSDNLDHRINVDRQDEFGVLMKTFNEMAEALQKERNSLRELAVLDPLTCLYNHREFFRLLQEEVDRACRYDHPLSLLMIDLDKFKDINDSLGHLVGDQVLLHVATVIVGQIRKSDHACRYGGDEFAVLLPETDLPEAFDFAERLQQAVAAQPVALENGGRLTASLSIGVAAFPEDAATFMELVAISDRALYRAKENTDLKVCCRRDLSG